MPLRHDARSYDLDVLARGAASAPDGFDSLNNLHAVVFLIHLDGNGKRIISNKREQEPGEER